MNKALLILCAGLLLTCHCFAQPQQVLRSQGRPQANAALQRILDAQHAGRVNAKATAQKSRVISLSTYQTGVLIDTLRYFYSNGRGSVPIGNINVLQYASTNLLFPNNDGYIGPFTYPRASCDSLHYFQSSGGGPLTLASRTVVNYLANNKVANDTQATYTGATRGVSIYEYSYNPAGYIIRQRTYDSLQTGANPYKPHYDDYDFYDAGNNKISDSLVNVATGQPQNKRVSTNNAAGYPTLTKYYNYNAGVWTSADSTVYTYDAYNRLLTTTAYDISSGIAYISETDSLGYTGTNPLEVYDRTFYYIASNHTIFNGYYFYGHLNAAGDNYDTTTGYMVNTVGGQVPSDREVSFFNSDGTLAEVDYYAGSPTGFSTTATIKYFVYYEQYDATGIMPIAGAANSLVIFPNPADAGLTIKMQQTSLTNGGAVVITDAMGRTMLRQVTNNEPELRLNTAAWPKGWYSLSLIGSDGSVLGRTTFLH